MCMNDFSAFAFVDEINHMVEEYVEKNFQRVSADDCGLDHRAGSVLFVNDDALVCRKNNIRLLDYYGGFEYVDKDCRSEVGDYVFFFSLDCDERVYNAINAGMDKLAEAA